jgi:4-amino-4-deoxy-L-arabinose transferase-like glycosyltransferase
MKAAQQVLLLLLVAGCLFFLGLGRLPLTEPDEGRNAEVAREMLVSHDWLTPHYDTLPYLDKPVIFFWLVAGSFRLFGTSERAARMPSALAALGTLLLVWLLACQMFGERIGLTAGIVFASSPLVIAFSRLVIFDMTLTLLVSVALAAFWFARTASRGRRAFEYLLFLAAGIATLTKGPVGFLLPLITILVYAAVQGKMGELRRLPWASGVALFLAICLPWFVAVSLRHPDFPRYAFWNESLLRFATGHSRRGGSVFYYLPVFLVGFLPWSFLLIFAGLHRWRGWKRLREASRPPEAFLLAWAATMFVFFSVSRSKLPAYFLPALPALAILMGKVWCDDVGEEPHRPPPDWLTAGFALLIMLGLLTAALPWLRVTALQKLAAKKVHPAVLGLLGPSVFYSGLIVAALGVLGRHLAARFRGRLYAAGTLALFASAVPLLVVRCWKPLETYALTSSARRLAEAILRGPERDLPVYGYYYFRTSLPFYLRRPIGLVTSDGDELTSNYIVGRWPELSRNPSAGALAPEGKPGALFLHADQFAALGRTSPIPFLVLARNGQVSDIARLERTIEPLWEAWQYSVWKVPGKGAP